MDDIEESIAETNAAFETHKEDNVASFVAVNADIENLEISLSNTDNVITQHKSESTTSFSEVRDDIEELTQQLANQGTTLTNAISSAKQELSAADTQNLATLTKHSDDNKAAAISAAGSYTDTKVAEVSNALNAHKTASDTEIATIKANLTSGDNATLNAAKGDTTTQITAHNEDKEAHDDIRELIEGLTSRLNAVANSTDTELDQLQEIVTYIKSNKSLIDSITTSKINVSDIVDALTSTSTSKVLSANQGNVLKGLIDSLTNVVSGKSPIGHDHDGADITRGTIDRARLPEGSTTAKGIIQLTDSISSTSTSTAATPNSVKTAYDLANSAKSTANSANKLNANNGSAIQPVYFKDGVPVVTTHKLEASVPSNAVFTDTDTKVTSVDNHYTPAKNDNSEIKVSASGATSTAAWDSTNLVTGVNLQRDTKGHVTGVTLNSVKMPTSPGYTLEYFGISASATELNYTDGVTSNIQTQLNGKSNTNHTHNYAGSSSAGGAATSANKLNAPSISTTANTTYTIDTYLALVKGTLPLGTQGYYTWKHTWSYAGHGLLSATIGSTTHKIQLAGAHCEFIGSDAGEYVLKITTATTSGTTGADFVTGATYQYNYHGSGYTPTWTIDNSIVGLSVNGRTITYTKNDGTTNTITTQDTNTTYGVVSTTANGLAPKLDGSTTKFLRGDGTWATPTDNNTDTKVTSAARTDTTRIYLTGSAGAETNTQKYDSNVYVDSTAGRLAATSFKIGGGCNLVYDSTNKCVSFQF